MTQNEKDIEIVQELLSDCQKFDVQANVGIILEAIQGPVTLQSAAAAAETIIHRLAINAEYSQAFRDLYEETGFQDCAANEQILLSGLHYGESVSLDSLRRVASETNIESRLALSQRGAAERASDQRQAAEAAERDALIAELTKPLTDPQGKPLRDANGRTRYAFEIDRIKSLSLDELRQISAERAEVQRLRALPREELRQVVHQQAQQKRQELFDSRFQKLPELYVPPGKSEGLPWSLNLFGRLPTLEQRRLLRVYGPDALNSALQK